MHQGYKWSVTFEQEFRRADDTVVPDAVVGLFAIAVLATSSSQIQKEELDGIKVKLAEDFGQQISNFGQLINGRAEGGIQYLGQGSDSREGLPGEVE